MHKLRNLVKCYAYMWQCDVFLFAPPPAACGFVSKWDFNKILMTLVVSEVFHSTKTFSRRVVHFPKCCARVTSRQRLTGTDCGGSAAILVPIGFYKPQQCKRGKMFLCQVQIVGGPVWTIFCNFPQLTVLPISCSDWPGVHRCDYFLLIP